MNKIEINTDSVFISGVEYVPKGQQSLSPALKVDGMEYVLVRTRSGGVHVGYRKPDVSYQQNDIRLYKSRNLWYWSGAAALNQLAIDGVSKPEFCKFTQEVDWIELTEVLAIYSVTQKAKDSIESVKVWKV